MNLFFSPPDRAGVVRQHSEDRAGRRHDDQERSQEKDARRSLLAFAERTQRPESRLEKGQFLFDVNIFHVHLYAFYLKKRYFIIGNE